MFKKFTPENQNTYQYKAHKNFTLTQADLTRHEFIKDSTNEVSKSYYDFARINFYLSGSQSSIVFIPQNKFDEEIKRGSFLLVDTTTGARIVDDSEGNLYSTNATFSQSVSALSSSDNYVGNIFYNVGAFAITETASFDGSNDYTDVTSGNYTLLVS